jgi:dienelactone hydrolase
MGLVYEDVSVVNEDGLRLTGWFVPGDNGATIMAAHGNPGGRQDELVEAQFLNQHGYSVLMGSFRAHDDCQGDQVTFGYDEQKDLAAWHHFLLSRADVDPDRIGLLGESMGGGTSILYAAKHDDIKALVTVSGFALTPEVVEAFIKYENPDLPQWLIPILSRLIVFWGEREADFSTRELNTESVIGDISPRPVLIMHGQSDDKIGGDSGQRLYDAAKEPKEFMALRRVQTRRLRRSSSRFLSARRLGLL